jgi:hypothetical protein
VTKRLSEKSLQIQTYGVVQLALIFVIKILKAIQKIHLQKQTISHSIVAITGAIQIQALLAMLSKQLTSSIKTIVFGSVNNFQLLQMLAQTTGIQFHVLGNA